jgi:CRP-like cAMP-binding protein
MYLNLKKNSEIMENATSTLQNYLNQFNPISSEDFEKIAPFFFMRELKVKERLTDEGELEENVYFIIKGIFRKYFKKEKEEFTTHFYKESEVCHSAASYYTGLPSPFIIEAIEPSVCVAINRRDLEMFMSQIPALEKVFRSVLAHLYVKKDLNEMSRVMQSKKDLFLEFCDKHPDLLQRVPQKYLASYLQIAPETFCRMKHVRYNMAKSDRQVEMNDAA